MRAHRTREPWVGSRRRWPSPFVQATEHHKIELLQACFERAENGKSSMISEGRPYRLLFCKLAHQKWIGGRFDLWKILARPRQRFHQLRGGFPVVAAPQTMTPVGLRCACEPFRCLAMQLHEPCK